MFRRSRFSVRPNVGTTGRAATATPQDPPAASQEPSETPKESGNANSATDVTNKSDVILKEKGEGNDQNGEGTNSTAALQRRKRFSIKPKVAPGRPPTLSRTPKSPVKAASATHVEAPSTDISKPSTSSQAVTTAVPHELQSPSQQRHSEDSKQSSEHSEPPPAEIAEDSPDGGKQAENVSGSQVKAVPARPPDKVPPSLPDKEASEISEKAKTLVSSKNVLSLPPSALSLSRLLNSPADVQRLVKAQKLRELLKQERCKEQRLKRAKFRSKEFNLDPTKMTMRDLIHYLPTSNPMMSSLEDLAQENETVVPPSPEREESPEQAQEPKIQPTKMSSGEEEVHEGEVAAEEEEEEDALMVPQVKVAEDGTLIIDEESLTVEVQRAKGPNPAQDRDPIFERGSTTTYSSFRKGTYTKPWCIEETDMFFLAVSMVGTDFSMICQLFPHRARSEIKNKFKREERQNAWRIDKAFKERRKLDIEYFSKLLEKVLEVQKDKKKIKSLSRKNATRTRKPKIKGKKSERKLSDVEEEDENEAPGLEEDAQKENEDQCNEGGSPAAEPKKKRKRKKKADVLTEEPSGKKNKTDLKSNEQSEAEIPEDSEATLPDDHRNSDMTEKTPDENTAKDSAVKPAKLSRSRAPKPLVPLGLKRGKKPAPSTKAKEAASEKGEECESDGASKEKANKEELPLSQENQRKSPSDDISSEEEDATVKPQKPTRYGRVPKPTQPLNYVPKEDPPSSASEATSASPSPPKSKPKRTAKRGKPSKPQSPQKSKKPKLVTLRSSKSDFSDDEDENEWEEVDMPGCSLRKDCDASMFSPTSLHSSNSEISEVDESMVELDILASMPDVLGISQDGMCHDSSCQQAQHETGTAEPCEHQLDLLVDVIDFLSPEPTEASQDDSYNEAAQTLLTIGNMPHISQSVTETAQMDCATGTTSAGVSEYSHLEEETVSAELKQNVTAVFAEFGQEATETRETAASLDLQSNVTDSCEEHRITASELKTTCDLDPAFELQSNPDNSSKNPPLTKAGRFTKVKPKPNLSQTSRKAQPVVQTEIPEEREAEKSHAVATYLSQDSAPPSATEETAPKISDSAQASLKYDTAEVKLIEKSSDLQKKLDEQVEPDAPSDQNSPAVQSSNFSEPHSEPSKDQTIKNAESTVVSAAETGLTKPSTSDSSKSEIMQGPFLGSVPAQESGNKGPTSPAEDIPVSQKEASKTVTASLNKRSRFSKVKPKPNLAQTSKTARSKPQTAEETVEKDLHPVPNPELLKTKELESQPTCAPSSSSQPTEEPSNTEMETCVRSETVLDVAEPDLTVTGVAEPDLTVTGVAEPDLTVTGVAEPDLTVTGVAEPDLTVTGVAEPDLTVTDEAKLDQTGTEIQNLLKVQLEPVRETSGDSGATCSLTEENLTSLTGTTTNSGENVVIADLKLSEPQVGPGRNVDSVLAQEGSGNPPAVLTSVEELTVSQEDGVAGSTSQSRSRRIQRIKPKPNLPLTSRAARSKPEITKEPAEKDSSPNLQQASPPSEVQLESNKEQTIRNESPIPSHTETSRSSCDETVTLESGIVASQVGLTSHVESAPVQEESGSPARLPISKQDAEAPSASQLRRSRVQKLKPKPNLPQMSRPGRSKPQAAKEPVEKESSPNPELHKKTTADEKPLQSCAASPEKRCESSDPVSVSEPCHTAGYMVGLVGQVDSDATASDQSVPENLEVQLQPTSQQTTVDKGSTSMITDESPPSQGEITESRPDQSDTESHIGQESKAAAVDEGNGNPAADSTAASACLLKRRRLQKPKPKPNLTQTSRAARSKPQTAKESAEGGSSPSSESAKPTEMEPQPSCSALPEKPRQTTDAGLADKVDLGVPTSDQGASIQQRDVQPEPSKEKSNSETVKTCEISEDNLTPHVQPTGSSLNKVASNFAQPKPEVPKDQTLLMELVSKPQSTTSGLQSSKDTVTEAEAQPTCSTSPETSTTGSDSAPSLGLTATPTCQDESSSAEEKLKTDAGVGQTLTSDSVEQNVPQRRQRLSKLKPKPNLGSPRGLLRKPKAGDCKPSEDQQTDTSSVTLEESGGSKSGTKVTEDKESAEDKVSKAAEKAAPVSHEGFKMDTPTKTASADNQPITDLTATSDVQSVESKTNPPITSAASPTCSQENSSVQGVDTTTSELTDSPKTSKNPPQTRRGRLIKPKPNLRRTSRPQQALDPQNTISSEAVDKKPESDLRPDPQESVEGFREKLNVLDSSSDDAQVSVGGVTQSASSQNASTSSIEGFQSHPLLSQILPEQVPSDPDEPFFILSLTEIPVSSAGEMLGSTAERLSYLPATDASKQQPIVSGESSAGDGSVSNVPASTEESDAVGVFRVQNIGPGPAADTSEAERSHLSLQKNPEDLQGNTPVQPEIVDSEETDIPPSKQKLTDSGRKAKLPAKPSTRKKKQMTPTATETKTPTSHISTTQDSDHPGSSVETVSGDAKILARGKVPDTSVGLQTAPSVGRSLRNRKATDFPSYVSETRVSPSGKAASRSAKVKTPSAARKQSVSHDVAPTQSSPQESHSTSTSPAQSQSIDQTSDCRAICSDPTPSTSYSTEASASQDDDCADSESLEEEPTLVSQCFYSDIFTEVDEG